jgi:pimeloyl-ACP methyl ester carboxylesterase
MLLFPFEDGGSITTDASGHGNDGNVNNAVFVPAGGIFASSAYRFDWAGRSNIQIPFNASQTVTGTLTLEAWIYPTAWDNIYAGYNRILSMYPCYLIRGVAGRAHFQIMTQNHGFQDVLDADAMTLNAWHYVVGTFDGQALRLYVDGTLRGMNDLGAPDTVVPNEQPIFIAENSQLNEGFSGIIDNVAIYKRARSQSEIVQTYTQSHIITATAGSHGSISPAGIVTATHGSDVLFTIAPDAGYYIAGVLVDGASVGSVSAYTFHDVSTDHTIAATFGQYEISGFVRATVSNLPLAGVIISASTGITTTTDASGRYTLTGLSNASHVITPVKSGLAFSPVTRTVKVPPGATNANFHGGAAYYCRFCRVIDTYGNPVVGASILADTGAAARSDDRGFFTLLLLEGKRAINISKPGYTFPQFQLTVTANIYERNFVGDYKPPIVMVHGWGSNAQETFGTDWTSIPQTLMRAGYQVSFANLQTLHANTPALEVNARVVQQAVYDARMATGKPKVIIIAHSMGGLVSRAYIEGPRYQNDVQALFTFGSPHLGTPVANLSAAVEASLGGPVAERLIGGPAEAQMTEWYMRYVFNRDYHRRPGVDYHLLGGDAPMDIHIATHCYSLWGWNFLCWDEWKPANQVPPFYRTDAGWLLGNIIPGQDDGFVSTDGATELDGYLDRASTDEVHAGILGYKAYFNRGFDTGIFSGNQTTSFTQCLKRVLIDRTTNTCGRRDYRGRVQIRTAAASAISSETSRSGETGYVALEETPFSPEQHSPVASGTLQAGQQVTHTFHVEGGQTTFAAMWDRGGATLTLVDPAGVAIDPAYVARHPDLASYSTDAAGASFSFVNAVPGAWQLVLTGGADLDAAGAGYAALTFFSSTLDMAVSLDKVWYAPGEQAVAHVTFSQAAESIEAQATLRYSDGATEVLSLALNDDGQFEATFTVSDIPGSTSIDVAASGAHADGAYFERAEVLAFQVSSRRAVLSGSYSDAPEPNPDDASLNTNLLVTVGIDATADGEVGLSADLVDGAGHLVAHAVASADVVVGPSTLVLSFPGTDIFAAQQNGPYILTNVLLTDQQDSILVLDEAADAYATGAYDFHAFAERDSFPTASAGGPYSVDEGDSITLTAAGNDPEGDALVYAWDLDDDGLFETPDQSVTFSAAGADGPSTYIVWVQVTDSEGFSAIGQTTVDVVNVAPAVSGGPDVTIQPGAVLSQAGLITDPGPDTWTATVDYGDGTDVQPLALTGSAFELNHLYSHIGVYSVTVTVHDDDDGKAADTVAVTVSALPGDLDGDGVAGAPDACPYSGLSATVVIDSCDTGVGNLVSATGCTIFDRIAACAVGVEDHDEFAGCVSQLTDDLITQGVLDGDDADAIQGCAATAAISPAAPQIALDLASSTVEVQWTHVLVDGAGRPIGVSRYEVWWSALPYAVPGEAGVAGPGAETGETAFTDTTAPAGSGLRRVYRVRAVSTSGTASEASNAVGVFSCPLVPGE